MLAPLSPASRIARIKDIDELIGQRLRAARLGAGMSQEHAGQAIGLTFQQIQKYEKGMNRISPGKLAMLADLFGRPIAWFYEGVETASAPTRGAAEQVLQTRAGKRLVDAFLLALPEDQVLVVDIVETFARRAQRQAQAAE